MSGVALAFLWTLFYNYIIHILFIFNILLYLCIYVSVYLWLFLLCFYVYLPLFICCQCIISVLRSVHVYAAAAAAHQG